MSGINVTTPPQCLARRPIGWAEMLRWRLFGPVRGFDPWAEARCLGYAGHERMGYAEHKDITGVQWLEP